MCVCVCVMYVAGISIDVALTVTENSVGIRRVQAQMEELEKKMTDMHNMIKTAVLGLFSLYLHPGERWGAGVETQKNVRGEIGGWGRVPFNETYAPSLSTIYDGA